MVAVPSSVPTRVIDLTTVEGPRATADVLLDIAQTVATELDTKVVLERLAALALEALGAERCAILLSQEGRPHVFRPAAAVSRTPDPAAFRKFLHARPIDARSTEVIQDLWRRPGPVAIDEADHPDVIPREWRELGSKSVALSVLRAGADAYGIIAIDYASGHHRFRSDELALLDAIACSAGVALRNAALFTRVTRSTEFERRLLKVTTSLLAGGPLQQVIDLVIAGFRDLLGVTHCSFNRAGPSGNSFFTLANRGWDAPEGERSFDEFPQEDVQRVIQAWTRDPREILRIGNVQTFKAWSHLVPPDIGPVMLVPLTVGDRVWGFVVAGREGQADFVEDEVRLAAAFGAQASLAVHEAELRDAAAGRAKAVDALRRLTDVLIGKADLRAALTSLNRGVARDVGLECLGVTFSARSLQTLLDVPAPTVAEGALLRSWRKPGSRLKLVRDGTGSDVARAPIRIAGRVAGLLRLRGAIDANPGAEEFALAIADGLGDVAYKAKLRRLAQRRAERLAVAVERERMARDLHDTVGQILYGISLRAQHLLNIDQPAGDAAEEFRARLGELSQLATQGVRDVRGAVHALAFLNVKSDGLLRSLRALVHEFERSTGIHAQLQVHGKAQRRLSDEVESCLYRVAHESLVNVDRHSRATGVLVTYRAGERTVGLTIHDDGVGLDQRQVKDWRSSAHFGLRMMARSVEALDGTLSVTPCSPRGLSIKAEVPIRRWT